MIFTKKSKKELPKEVELTRDNLENWPDWKSLVENGKVVIDAHGKLRYPHGAPVGKMILVRIKKDGTPIYKESACEWFDPDSLTTERFE